MDGIGKQYVVCRYADAGNMEGAYAENVAKPQDGVNVAEGVVAAGW